MDAWWLYATGMLASAAMIECLAGQEDDDIATGDRETDVSRRDLFSALSQVVGGLAHEIKNPLSTIQLNLKLLGEDLQRYDDEEHARLARRVERVRDESDRLRQTLDDFLRYAGKVELSPVRVDLCEIVRELRDFFSPQTDAGGIIFRDSLPDHPVFCRVDINLIKQALLNLMINATEAMEAGGELLLRVRADGIERAIVEVIDTGPGIEPETQEIIFQPYWTSKKSGTGLGLPTARRVVREHGGDLKLESEPGKGTRFIVTLPMHSPETTDES